MNTKVLIADDDPLMRTIIVVSLGEAAEVVEAADGDEALSLLEQNEFDLIFLDWDMPGANGLEVLQTIRARGCSMPIIMVTAEAKREQILKAIRAGASDYLIKPFESEALREKLEKHYPTHATS